MSKESKFKEWDKQFSRADIEGCRKYWRAFQTHIHTTLERWDMVVDKWTQDFVQHCVYYANDAYDWQEFRVSLKGLETWEKLVFLKMWYDKYCMFGVVEMSEAQREQWKRNKCRIDNYIGALVRGGQLSPTGYKILK